MDLSTVLSALAVLAAIGFPLLARRDLLTKLQERDQAREEWRQGVSEELRQLRDARQSTDLAAYLARDKEREQAWWEWRRKVDRLIDLLDGMPYRVKQLEEQHAEYKDWKHAKADPYIGNYDALEKRVSRCERVLNGKLQP